MVQSLIYSILWLLKRSSAPPNEPHTWYGKEFDLTVFGLLQRLADQSCRSDILVVVIAQCHSSLVGDHFGFPRSADYSRDRQQKGTQTAGKIAQQYNGPGNGK